MSGAGAGTHGSAMAGPVSQVGQAALVARYALRESLRRRVLPAVGALTAAFLILYALGAHFAFREIDDASGGGLALGSTLDDRALAGATLVGLAMFASLFLGAVVATFLTLGVVRGDAESGLLQSIVARPIGRTTVLLARLASAGAVAVLYVIAVFAISILITAIAGEWTPDRPVQATLQLAVAIAVLTCLSVLASVFTGSTSQGIVVLMLFGAGLTGGLLGQIGDALDSGTLVDISRVVSWALPFEALYQDGLYALTADTSGITGFLLSLGPFGGAQRAGSLLLPWAAAYCAVLLVIAGARFKRRDL